VVQQSVQAIPPAIPMQYHLMEQQQSVPPYYHYQQHVQVTPQYHHQQQQLPQYHHQQAAFIAAQSHHNHHYQQQPMQAQQFCSMQPQQIPEGGQIYLQNPPPAEILPAAFQHASQSQQASIPKENLQAPTVEMKNNIIAN
jgi:hypothetical protein